MIHEFKVKNHLSFKEEQTLSFEATKDTTGVDYLTYQVTPKLRLLKIVVIYGANASGKSNVLKSIEFLFDKMFTARKNKSYKTDRRCFALDENSCSEPSEFYISFYVKNVRYVYSLKLNDDMVLEETMYYYPIGKQSLFYSRIFDKEQDNYAVEFGNTLKISAKVKNDILINTFHNSTLLSVCQKIEVDAPAFVTVWNWLKDYVHEVVNKESVRDVINIVSDGNAEMMAFFKNGLDDADFNITDINVRNIIIPEELKRDIYDSDIPDEVKSDIISKISDRKELCFKHHVKDGEYELSMMDESEGTLSYLSALAPLYNMIAGDHIYIYDELGSTFHYDLLLHYLKSFIFKSVSSQLIFTTHDQMLLDEDLIRRDMVWFTEKDREMGASKLYSAAEFKLHKNLSLYKAYNVGRLGAVPSFKNELRVNND